jgi:hypothetical protein
MIVVAALPPVFEIAGEKPLKNSSGVTLTVDVEVADRNKDVADQSGANVPKVADVTSPYELPVC